MNILLVVGSARKESYNQMVANYLIDKYKTEYDIKQADIANLPMYNADIEMEEIDSVDKALEDVKWANGVVFITPEYNNSIPALLKNFIDWISRKGEVFIDKPIIIVGASNDKLGAYQAQDHLRNIMRTRGLQALIIGSIDSYLSEIDKKVADKKLKDKDAKLLDEKFKELTDYLKK